MTRSVKMGCGDLQPPRIDHATSTASGRSSAVALVRIRSDWGQHGGLRLANSAKAIKLGEVVRHTEPDMAIATCFEPVNAPCAILLYCVLRKALERARCLHRGV